MTYCVALRLNRGLVFAADTRTSAGNDNVAAVSASCTTGANRASA